MGFLQNFSFFFCGIEELFASFLVFQVNFPKCFDRAIFVGFGWDFLFFLEL